MGTDNAPASTVIDNHWKSKGGDEAVNVVRRTDQAKHVAALVQEKLDADPAANIVVLGDLNDYYRSGPVETVRQEVNPPLVHVYDMLRLLNRYTYVFNGASQVLDHLLGTPGLIDDIAEARPIHINADFAYPLELDSSTVIHSSDHDPVLVRVRPGRAAWMGGSLATPGILVALQDGDGREIGAVETDDYGEFRFWNLTPDVYRVKLSAPSGVLLSPQELTVDVSIGANQLPPVAVRHRAAVSARGQRCNRSGHERCLSNSRPAGGALRCRQRYRVLNLFDCSERQQR